MRILFIVDSLGKGGSERRMIELIKHVTTNTDHKVVLVCLSDCIEYGYVYQLPIELYIVKRRCKYDFSIFLTLYQIAKKYRPDIVHSWSSMSNLYALPIVKILKIKFVTSVIADAPNNLDFRNKAFRRARIVFPFADRITGNSLAGLSAYRAPLEKSVCIYNGFDENRLSSLQSENVLKKRLGIENKLVVGMVAGFEERKDYSTVVTAAKSVIDQNSQTVFLLIGDGRLKARIMQMVPDTYNESILFLGKLDDVESYISIMDIAILCTNTKIHQEGISNSIMEYMACRKPVIATQGGGTDEIVIHNRTGYLIPPDNVGALNRRIVELIGRPDLRSEFGNAGFLRVREVFTLEKMCTSFYCLYDELLCEK